MTAAPPVASPATADRPLLVVEDLRVTYPTRTRVIEAVRGVTFRLGRERLGIVGESGSGKSQTGRAILGLTPPPGIVAARRLDFDGIDLTLCGLKGSPTSVKRSFVPPRKEAGVVIKEETGAEAAHKLSELLSAAHII